MRSRPSLGARPRLRRSAGSPDENVRLLKQLGIPRILVPRRWGGDERLFAEMVEQVTELAHGCVSTAWCAGLFAEHPWILAHLDLEAQREVWSDGPDVIVSMSFNPSAPATRTAGGFRLNGKWFFTSGCDHAEWLLFVAPVGTPDVQPPEVRRVPGACRGRDHRPGQLACDRTARDREQDGRGR